MAINYNVLAQPKGVPRKLAKARSDRAEAKVIKRVRAIVEARDGRCRLYWDAWSSVCDGPSEWAHFGDKKRFKTRKMSPEQRHTTAGSLMLCRKHHADYDQGRLVILAGPDGCDGPLQFFGRAA